MMISDRRSIISLLLAALFLLPSACSIQVSISSDTGSISEEIAAADDEAVRGSTVIATDGLSHSIEGSGNLKDSHSVSNHAGARAEVGVDIRKANSYSYDYWLSPGAGSLWPASQVAAGESMDVENASHIQAYASASSAQGQAADVSLVVSDPEKKACLSGYNNVAMASKNQAFASQAARGISAPAGYIQTEAESSWIQLRSRPLRYDEWDAAGSIRVDRGVVAGYSDLASASRNGVMMYQRLSGAMGTQIRADMDSSSWEASLFQGLKRTSWMESSLKADGANLSVYDVSVKNSRDGMEARLNVTIWWSNLHPDDNPINTNDTTEHRPPEGGIKEPGTLTDDVILDRDIPIPIAL